MTTDENLTGNQGLQDRADVAAREALKRVGDWTKVTPEDVGVGTTQFYVTRQRLRAIQAEDKLQALTERLNKRGDDPVAVYEAERESFMGTISDQAEELIRLRQQVDTLTNESNDLHRAVNEAQAKINDLKVNEKQLLADLTNISNDNVELRNKLREYHEAPDPEEIRRLREEYSKRFEEMVKQNTLLASANSSLIRERDSLATRLHDVQNKWAKAEGHIRELKEQKQALPITQVVDLVLYIEDKITTRLEAPGV